jgi:hypothetical protein
MKTTIAIVSRAQAEKLVKDARDGREVMLEGESYIVTEIHVERELGKDSPRGHAILEPVQPVFRATTPGKEKMRFRELPLDDKSIAGFRFQASVEKPMSLRSDKPHIFFWNGWYRVSLWNRKPGDNATWEAAHRHARKLQATLFEEGSPLVRGVS